MTLMLNTIAVPMDRPPLFVSGFSGDGIRQEALIYDDSIPPKWLAGDVDLEITAPSGANAHLSSKGVLPKEVYSRCLALIGTANAWRRTIRSRGQPPLMPKCELWSNEDVEISSDATWIYVRPLGSRKSKGASSQPLSVAVVRNADGTVLHTLLNRLLYLDISRVASNAAFIPRAIVDTGLAGAFWGFVEQNHYPASRLVAERLLRHVFGKHESDAATIVDLVAAAHAVLMHDKLLERFGHDLLAILGPRLEELADLHFLRTLISLSIEDYDDDTGGEVAGQVRNTIAVLADNPPVFGETLRFLDAKYSLFVHLVDQWKSVDGEPVRSELKLIGARLQKSFVGGQLAVYIGNPDERIVGSEAQKKTLLN